MTIFSCLLRDTTILERLQRRLVVHCPTVCCSADFIETKGTMTRHFLMYTLVLLFMRTLTDIMLPPPEPYQNLSPQTLRPQSLIPFKQPSKGVRSTLLPINVLTLQVKCTCILSYLVHVREHTHIKYGCDLFVCSSNFNIHSSLDLTLQLKYVIKLHNTSICFALHSSLNVLI